MVACRTIIRGEYEKWAEMNKKHMPRYVANQLQEQVKEILDAEPNAATSASPITTSPAPPASGMTTNEDIDKLLNWALLHGEKVHATTCHALTECTCASNRSLACNVCAEQQGSPLKLISSFCQLTEADGDPDDEAEMVAALKKVAHTLQVGPKPHQPRASSTRPKPLSKSQLGWIVSQVNAAKIELPNFDEIDDADCQLVWALAGSGSAAHVVNARRVFPGAVVRESKGHREGVQCQAADGGLLPSRGEAEITYVTSDGQQRRTLFFKTLMLACPFCPPPKSRVKST